MYICSVIKRILQAEINTLLKQFPAVAILGPRQVGKTTLAKQLSAHLKKEVLYLDLEKTADKNKLTDSHTYLSTQKDKCVILDEVQLMPELFSALRPLIDEFRKPGRFILLGSASPHLVKGVSESLAGRISYTELTPIGLMEMPKNIGRQTFWLRGGFPNSLLAKTDAASSRWLKSFIRSYVERDIDMLFGVNLSNITMQRLWTMLAHANGGIWNAETFARSLGITAPTALRYLHYLEAGYMVRRLQPWFVNATKRLVKSPKVYVRDSGILHALLNLGSIDDILSHPIAGTSWEGFVIEQIFQLKPPDTQAYFYRTHDGAECDVVLVKGIKPIACIEIKISNAPTISKGFYECVADLKPEYKFVVTPDSDEYKIKEDVMVTSLHNFLKNHLPII